MKETEAIIERIRRINPDYQHLELAVDDSLLQLMPGQSMLARIGKTWNPYLREQWWPVATKGSGKIIVERPGTVVYEPGQIVSLLGIVGAPYRFRKSLRNVLLLAYDTAPTPMLMMIHWLLSNHVNVTLALLGSARRYDTAHLSAEVEVVHGEDDLTWADQVLTLGWADQVFVTVARDDEMARFARLLALFQEKRNDVPKNYVFGVFQSLLPCGTGACDACMLRHDEHGLLRVCTDGPSFDLTQLHLPPG